MLISRIVDHYRGLLPPEYAGDTCVVRHVDMLTLAFVQTAPDSDREFSFCRDPGADMMLTPEEVPESIIEDAKIFHFGTLSLTGEPVRAAAVISFDPNLRLSLWRDMAEARAMIAWGLARADVVKIADNELEFMTGRISTRAPSAPCRNPMQRSTQNATLHSRALHCIN